MIKTKQNVYGISCIKYQGNYVGCVRVEEKREEFRTDVLHYITKTMVL